MYLVKSLEMTCCELVLYKQTELISFSHTHFHTAAP